MTALFGLLKFVVLTAGLFALATSLVIGCIYPRVRGRLRRIEPARRARLLTLLSGGPLLVALLHTTLCFVPSIVGVAFPAFDHCAHHAHGDHPHLCIVHLPGGAGTLASSLLASTLAVVALCVLCREVARLSRSARWLAALVHSARPGRGTDTLVVETELPFAAATPLGRRILLSSRLVDELSDELLAAVVEHERAHVRRRDPLRLSVARLLSVAHVGIARRAMLDDLDLACEQACDEEAGSRIADRLTVARALVAVERLFARRPEELGLVPARFAGSNVVARVEALLRPPLPGCPSLLERHAVTLVVLLSALLTDPLHHAAEVVVGLLV